MRGAITPSAFILLIARRNTDINTTGPELPGKGSILTG
jgi:hypothetical protein